MTVVIAGRPNAGKSSLLNRLAGYDSAIVTDIPGTTRDVLREQITLDGMPLHVIDTAGLRASDDPIEREGVRRAGSRDRRRRPGAAGAGCPPRQPGRAGRVARRAAAGDAAQLDRQQGRSDRRET